MISLWHKLEETQPTDWQAAGKLEPPPPKSVVNVNYFQTDSSKVNLHFNYP